MTDKGSQAAANLDAFGHPLARPRSVAMTLHRALGLCLQKVSQARAFSMKHAATNTL